MPAIDRDLLMLVWQLLDQFLTLGGSGPVAAVIMRDTRVAEALFWTWIGSKGKRMPQLDREAILRCNKRLEEARTWLVDQMGKGG